VIYADAADIAVMFCLSGANAIKPLCKVVYIQLQQASLNFSVHVNTCDRIGR